MKIAVLNNSGNVGKTLVSRHLIAPRLGSDCKRFAIESINDGADGDKYRGRNLRAVITALQLEEHAVVDIGSSNIEDVYEALEKMPRAVEMFDLFVIPTTPLRKQHVDTVATIERLRTYGAPLEKIRVIFNMVEHGTPVHDACPDLVAEVERLGLSTRAVIHQNELYELVGHEAVDNFVADIDAMKRDLAAATTKLRKQEIATAIGVALLADGVKRELDAVFDEVVGPLLGPLRRSGQEQPSQDTKQASPAAA